MRNHFKDALIVAALLANAQGYAERVHQLGSGWALAFYFVSFAAFLSALLVAARARGAGTRWFWGAALGISLVFCETYRRSTGHFIDYPMFKVLFESAGGSTLDALKQFAQPVIVSAAGGAFLLLGLGLAPGESRWSRGRLPEAAPVGAIALLIAALFASGGRGTAGLPSAFTPLAYGALIAYENVADGRQVRQPVSIPRSGATLDHDIIFIIDESVRGDYLEINSPNGVHSGLASSRAEASIYNFGLAASATNCSVGTNVTFRYGGTRDNYRKIQRTMPSIWQYAKAAGLRTVFIDDQRTLGALSNRMTPKDLRWIDKFIQFDRVSVVQRDMRAVDEIARLAADRVPSFIVLNKVGAHFPVNDKFPDDFMIYEPALPRGLYGDVSDMDSGADTQRRWDLYKNSYKNTVAWNVGRFFDRFFKEVDLRKAVVLYTSDHGQNFREHGGPGLATHCNAEPSIEEGLVPLVVIEGKGLKTLDWRAARRQNFGRASHYEIFPTLLSLMGYDRAEVAQTYGPRLTERPADPFTFNARFEARFRMQPVWVKVDLGKVMGPPPERRVAEH